MNKIFKYLLIGALLVSIGSCTDELTEINENPNEPALEQAAPDMLLTNAIEQLSDRVHNIFLGHEMGSCWVQHMAKVQYTDEDRYIPRVSVINAAWSSLYATSGQDVALIKQVAELRENDNYKGVALVLEAYITSLLTDLYGDVPYTQAWQGSASEAIVSPVYDSQASIYTALIANLETANSLLDASGSSIKGDILYDNDIDSWKKFANSLRLRLLLRMSARDEGFVTTEMTKMLNAPETYPIFTGFVDDAQLNYLGSAPNNHPINENRKTRDDHRVSASLIDLLYTDAPSADYRVAIYAELAEASSDFVGLPNGMKSSDAANYLGNGLKQTSELGELYTEATAPGVLMTYSELQFILAEAAHKAYIPGGEAKAEEYYYEGIKSSYYKYGDELSEKLEMYWKTAFISWGWDQVTPILDYGYQDFIDWGGWAYDPANAMEQIATQKWVAMFDQGLQSWIEWRRLDLPVLTPAVDGVLSGQMPIRVFYPSDEYSRNKTNVEAAVASQGKDDLLTPVWWDVN
ncbi:SusD/RagB family nutrient-binding outer membrane lipoprotein [Carboxylicivirga mesophila]|uniref:SusD/RagB family nutrient-binding outer membrane lipoprotein n=1 Tax=Carboxylicivirga mesophila TaxID=1166478 RepID=A0ABS5K7D5_9BACT|nr:SusD/RagB family nutrient-binding outer membrane lipoprotein [Carboxylicivirga mesophila]MBS2210898.1 SusD/RagB family nutrient-binding outer membrane lipoprotein [Carboxylicivirga mesophila]